MCVYLGPPTVGGMLASSDVVDGCVWCSKCGELHDDAECKVYPLARVHHPDAIRAVGSASSASSRPLPASAVTIRSSVCLSICCSVLRSLCASLCALAVHGENNPCAGARAAETLARSSDSPSRCPVLVDRITICWPVVAELSSSRLSCLYIPPFSPGVGLRGAPSEGKGETIRGEPYVATT